MVSIGSLRLLRFTAIAGGILVAPGTSHAGAWTQAAGSLYNRTSGNRYASEKEFDTDGKRQSLPLHGEFVDLNVVNYVEYGVTSRFTAIASFVVKRLRSENDVRVIKSWGIGDVDLAVRGKLAEGSFGVTALQVVEKFPSGYDTDVVLPLGSGKAETEARLLYARSLGSGFPGYGGLEVGYRWRSGDPEDELRYLAEIGGDLGARFYARAKLDGIRGLRSASTTDVNGNPTVRNSYDLGTLDMTAGRRFGSHVSVEAGFAPGIYGNTTTAGSTLTLAVAFVLTGLTRAPKQGSSHPK